MTENEYWGKVYETFLAHIQEKNKWRWGQTCMNVLWAERPELYDRAHGGDLDPWNADASTPIYDRFVDFIGENW